MAGEIELARDTLENASLHLTIHVGSLEIMDEVSSLDRREIERVMFDEVLQENMYPRIEYQSTPVNVAKTGENHGVTRGVSLDAQVVPGEDTLRAQGAFAVLQSDYGLRIASVAGGTLKLQDELKCASFILGRRQDREPRN
jgi:polyisoprenoid-binding protein YceI